jgi:hypothetical protein
MTPAHTDYHSTRGCLTVDSDRASYDEAWAAFAGLTDAELAGVIEGLEAERNAYQGLDPASAEVGRMPVAPLLRAAREVAARRLVSPGRGTTHDAASRDFWTELAQDIRARADIVGAFLDHGHPLSRAREEWHGPCFACGGADRLVVWPGPPGRYWCRRECGARGDVITALRTFRPGLGFRDALTDLAAVLGLPTPVVDLAQFAGGARDDRLGHRDRAAREPVSDRSGLPSVPFPIRRSGRRG